MFPLTHDEEVLLLLHGLVDDLGGDLAGVVPGHVRVYVHQHHALTVASVLLQGGNGGDFRNDMYYVSSQYSHLNTTQAN